MPSPLPAQDKMTQYCFQLKVKSYESSKRNLRTGGKKINLSLFEAACIFPARRNQCHLYLVILGRMQQLINLPLAFFDVRVIRYPYNVRAIWLQQRPIIYFNTDMQVMD